MLNPELLAILRCPKCRGVLQERSSASAAAKSGDAEPTATLALICAACQLSYAVDDGIPNLLIEEAQSYAA